VSIKKFIVFAFISALIFIGCYDEEYSSAINYSITSPKQGWTYYNDSKILLALNIDTHEITWRSSIDGYLGEGNHLLLFLSVGNHLITSDVLGTEKTINVTVAEKDAASLSVIKTLVNRSSIERFYPSGKYYSYLMTFDGSLKGFKKGNNMPESRMQKKTVSGEQPEFITRDMRFAINGKLAMTIKKAAIFSRSNLNSALGKKKIFYVPNTSSIYTPPHEISAVLFYNSDRLNVWTQESESVDEALLLECISTVENSILCRLEQIWGQAADINGNGRLDILVSKTINNEGVAIGFFNPADFYKRETNINSAAYNPASNEMDIIYIAVPDSTSTSYGKENIIATIAHEFTHAITYTQKTWQKELMGQSNAKREELFLDEGLSHLSELLCGIGYSGGTVKYLQRYLMNTANYSICDKNIYGQDDSVGMRGIITLFLSWLFWKEGGMEYGNADFNAITDAGGISFLKRLINSNGTGWENIGTIAGTRTDKLFEEMINEINLLRINNTERQYKVDMLTGEPVELFPGINLTVLQLLFRYRMTRSSQLI